MNGKFGKAVIDSFKILSWYRASLLLLPRVPQLSWNVLAGAGFLCDKVIMLRDMIEVRPCIFLEEPTKTTKVL
jgi:hypothetical protein